MSSSFLFENISASVSIQNVEGVFCEESFSGIEATCIQHEIDHLDGKLASVVLFCKKKLGVCSIKKTFV